MTIERVLEQRLGRVTPAQQRRAVVVSVLLHAVLVAGFWVTNSLSQEPPERLDYVPVVRVVTPAALGVEKPPPPPPRPKPKPKTPPPKPAAAPPPPPPPSEAPVIATKKPVKPPEPPPPPAPQPAAPPPPETQQRKGISRGNPLGASSSAVVGVEDPDFTYGYYLDNMIAILSRNWVRPPVGRRIDQAVVYYRILADGGITDLRIVESSGSEVFDRAALRAVEASAPLPPLPSGYKKRYLGIQLVVK